MFRRASLSRMIERLGAARGDIIRDGRRPLPPGLSGILDEIDETVMARRLVFHNDRGEEMTLEIRSRRLFWAGLGQLAGGTRQAGSGLVLSQAASEEISALVDTLRRFGMAGTLSVESGPPMYQPALDEAGLPATVLYRLSGQGSAPLEADCATDPEPSLEDFAATCHPLSLALVLRGPDGNWCDSGDTALVAELVEALENFMSFQPGDFNEMPLGATLSRPGTPDASLALFADGQGHLAAYVAPEQEAALQAAWADWLARQSGP
ncbi:hypothetical protein SAMN04488026_102265 [Aliiruegeria lutimaris]|uniref:Uncharacterized protein n=2 Tax=Aliiruegeria lutimaris TaxID=571298 RepID=A0A1G8VXJ7_9RHOB|nr:hypothetical protein SAMN04488026_102265 [Aliiruegeria lutimaris]